MPSSPPAEQFERPGAASFGPRSGIEGEGCVFNVSFFAEPHSRYRRRPATTKDIWTWRSSNSEPHRGRRPGSPPGMLRSIHWTIF